MTYQELIILLPCHSLEDFPVHHDGDEAHGLLSAWTALWHPALIASAGQAPSWSRVDDPPEELANRLIVVPAVSQQELPTGFAQRAKDEGAVVIRRKNDREQILATALEPLGEEARRLDEELVADFLALGYCYLQVELLTRQMRYASNLDELHFNSLVVQAAESAAKGESTEARERLTACFDLLAEERDHYYAVDAFLLDLTLVASTTLGADLRGELQSGAVVNLLLPAGLLEEMADKHPETLIVLREAIEAGRACIVGGDLTEHRWPLMSLESMLRDWREAQQIYEKHLGRKVTVYGRRRFGLTPVMPQVLQNLGFQGALHATMDEGRFPEGGQVKTRWEGEEGAAIDAIARAPQDAAKAETFLSLAIKLGETMDSDHIATLVLAHWPGRRSQWYDDLRRISRFNAALGRFQTMEDYFRDSEMSGHLDRFEADQYRSPYLKQAVIRKQADPISTSIRYWRRRFALENLQALTTLAQLLRPAPDQEDAHDALAREVDRAAEGAANPELDERLNAAVAGAADMVADALPREGSPQQGCLVLNPLSFVRRVPVDVSELNGSPTVERPVYAASSENGRTYAVIDTPPMGYVWLSAGNGAAGRRKPNLAVEDEMALRNEFFEAVIDRTTGCLAAFYAFNTRGNRLSQQLAVRIPSSQRSSWGEPDGSYSVMAADSVEVTFNSAAFAEITCRGRLLDTEGENLCGFVQRYRACRGSRVLRIEIELDPRIEAKSDGWNSYVACRFAWSDETSLLTRVVNQTHREAEAKRLEAPLYVQVGRELNSTILTGGLPFHRRCDFRMLDSILITRGESERKFTVGVGLDLKHPLHEAMSLLAPPAMVFQNAPPPKSSPASWLLQIDSRNVVATSWSPLIEDGRAVGFVARLLETAGRATRATLSGFRAITAACQRDFRGQSLGECGLQDGRARVELAAGEWVEVEARWG